MRHNSLACNPQWTCLRHAILEVPSMSHEPLACILSPDLLYKLARESADEHRSAILQTLELDQSFRLRRAELAARQVARPADAHRWPGSLRRRVRQRVLGRCLPHVLR